MSVDVLAFDIPRPDDLTELSNALDRFDLSRLRRLALLLRVPGEYEDGSREKARAALADILGSRGLADRSEYITVIGSEGATTPCGYALVDMDGPPSENSSPRLALGLARVEPPAEHVFGTVQYVQAVAKAVKTALADAKLEPADVQTIIVNVPQPTTGAIGAVARRCRAAAALGAGIAIDEIEDASITGERILDDLSLYTSRVQTFAGPAITHIEVIAVGNKPYAGGHYFACSTTTRDLIDARPLRRLLLDAGLPMDADGEIDTSRLVATVAKLGVLPDGTVDGAPTTIFSSATPPEKHVRAAMSGVLGSTLHTTRTVSTFDPIQQSPAGGGTILCIVRSAE